MFPFSCSGFRVVVFIGLVVELVEGGGEDGVETIQDYVDVETIKLAVVFQKKLGEAVHRPQDLCSKRVDDHNFVFVDDDKIPKFGCKDAVFAEDKNYCNCEYFQLEIEGVKVLGDRPCRLGQGFDIANTFDESPFCQSIYFED